MQQDFTNTLNDLGKSSLEAVQQLGDINSKLIEQLVAQQLDAATLCVAGGVQQLELTQETKDAKDYMNKQTALVEEYASKWLDLAKVQVGLAQNAGKEYQSWLAQGLEQGMQQANGAAEKIEKVMKKAAATQTTPAE